MIEADAIVLAEGETENEALTFSGRTQGLFSICLGRAVRSLA